MYSIYRSSRLVFNFPFECLGGFPISIKVLLFIPVVMVSLWSLSFDDEVLWDYALR